MRKRCGIVMAFGLFLLLTACSSPKEQTEKLQDCEYTVVEQEQVPKELMEIIEEKKTDMFKLSYTDEGYLYIVMGYGKQAGGGYSIVVDGLFETTEEICFQTTLLGPVKEEQTNVETYPYIVVKMEDIDKDISYE